MRAGLAVAVVLMTVVVTMAGVCANPGAAQDGRLIEQGRQLWTERACLNCHMLKGEGAPGPGPDLTDVGKRRTKDWLRKWLRDPPAVKPGTLMPKFDWSEKQLDGIIAYLTSSASTAPAAPAATPTPGPSAVGDPVPPSAGQRSWWPALAIAGAMGAVSGMVIAAWRRQARRQVGERER
ncbi:MAG TPA: c-type cytochrome [Armatimonadota bacterium]|nr:c-type cytochrome [Armatimonadota bacterium]